MTEYTREVIQDMVTQFMTSYKREVEAHGLTLARGYADQYLADLSKDLPSEAADSFVRAAMKPLNTFLQGQMEAADTAAEELSEDVVNED